MPPLALALVTIAMLTAGAAGGHPMWKVRELNLAEAAGSRDDATVVLLVERGADPNASYQVARGVIDDHPGGRLTPVEAAVAARRVDTLALLLRHGAELAEPRRVALLCASRRRLDADMIKFLEDRGGEVSCDGSQNVRGAP